MEVKCSAELWQDVLVRHLGASLALHRTMTRAIHHSSGLSPSRQCQCRHRQRGSSLSILSLSLRPVRPSHGPPTSASAFSESHDKTPHICPNGMLMPPIQLGVERPGLQHGLASSSLTCRNVPKRAIVPACCWTASWLYSWIPHRSRTSRIFLVIRYLISASMVARSSELPRGVE